MDAASRRRTVGGFALAAVLAGTGCNVLGGSNLGASNLLSRAQAPQPPAGPVVVPGALPAPLQPAVPTAPATVSPDTSPTLQPVNAEASIPQIRVVAVIGSDVFITDDEVWQIVRQRIAGENPEKSAQLSADQQKARDKKLFDEVLKRLIERELILNDFLTKLKKGKPQAIEGLYKEAGTMAAKTFKEFKNQNKIESEEKLIKALAYQGISYKLLMRQLERDAILQLYLDTLLRELGKNISIAEVERYYRDNPEEFKTEERFVWQDLFVSFVRYPNPADAKTAAEKYRALAAAGQDFAGLVKLYGHGDSPLRNGAGIGTNRKEIQPTILTPHVVALAAGQVSPVIPTETGYHIVKMVEREDAGIRPFDEKVQSFIRRKLTAIIQDREKEKLVETLLRQTTVKIIAE